LFDAIIDSHNNKQLKNSGLNVDLIDTNLLRDDPNYHKIRESVDTDVIIIGTAAYFTLIERTDKFRNLLVQMRPVDRKAVTDGGNACFECLPIIFQIAAILPAFFYYASMHIVNVTS